MAPTLTAVRHAQGYHNLSIANHQLHDPKLTPVGEEQCRILSETFPDMKNVDLVVASPIKRTIYTALMTFEEVLRTKNLKVICLPELQETSDLPCDTGSSPEELAKEFEGMPVDLELVKPGWNVKRLKWAPTATAIQKRARDARVWLMARPEKNVVLVSHGGFLHYFTEDWTGSDRFQGTGWANTEYRSYNFSGFQPDEAHLLETSDSKHRRLGDEKPFDHNETTQLKRVSTAEREKQAKDRAQKSGTTSDVMEIQAKLKERRRDDVAEGYSFL